MCITSGTLFMLMVSTCNSKCALPRTIVWTARRPWTLGPLCHCPRRASRGTTGHSPCQLVLVAQARVQERPAGPSEPLLGASPHARLDSQSAPLAIARSREITARSCTTSNASADPTGAVTVSRTCRHIQGLSRGENLAANHRPRRIADLCVRTAHSLFLAEC